MHITSLLAIWISLACARASNLTTTNMYIARARCESQLAVGSSGLNARIGRGCRVQVFSLILDTLVNPFAYPGLNLMYPFCYLRGNVHFDWFNQYLCTGEHLQSDLGICQFDFMSAKPHDEPPLLCANVQTEMRFGVEQLVFTTPTLWKQELFHSKSHFTLHVSAKQRRHTVWFHKHWQLRPFKLQGHPVSLWRWPFTWNPENVLFIEIFFRHV